MKTGLIALVLAALTAFVYLPVRGFDFTQVDDPAYVTENAYVRAGLTSAGVKWAFTTGHAANWHPLTWVSHMLDVQAFGVNAGAHHLVNAGLHILSTVLLLVLLARLTGALWRSAFVAAVFALHPLHVESVAWVAERKDLLSGVFWMLTIWSYAAYVREPARWRMAVVTILFALGLMAKPMLVTLPFVLLLMDVWPLGRLKLPHAFVPFIPLVKEKLVLFALAAASSVITIVAQQQGGATAALEAIPLGQRIDTAVVAPLTYLQKMFWPADLSFLYPLRDPVSATALASSALVLITLTAIALRCATSRPAILTGWLWYLITLVPVAGLIQVGVQVIADRYTYIPMIGISILLAWAPPDSWGRNRIARAAGIAAIVGLAAAMAIATSRQLPVWRNNVTLWTRATMVALKIDEFAAHMSLGGQLLTVSRLAEARQHFSEATRVRSDSAEAWHLVGITFLRDGSAHESIAPLENAVRLAPANPNPRTDLASAYVLSNRIDEAIREYRWLVAHQPAERRFQEALAKLLSRSPGGK